MKMFQGMYNTFVVDTGCNEIGAFLASPLDRIAYWDMNVGVNIYIIMNRET